MWQLEVHQWNFRRGNDHGEFPIATPSVLPPALLLGGHAITRNRAKFVPNLSKLIEVQPPYTWKPVSHLPPQLLLNCHGCSCCTTSETHRTPFWKTLGWTQRDPWHPGYCGDCGKPCRMCKWIFVTEREWLLPIVMAEVLKIGNLSECLVVLTHGWQKKPTDGSSVVCASGFPSVYLSICLSICLSIYLSICLSICFSIYLSIYLSI